MNGNDMGKNQSRELDPLLKRRVRQENGMPARQRSPPSSTVRDGEAGKGALNTLSVYLAVHLLVHHRSSVVTLLGVVLQGYESDGENENGGYDIGECAAYRSRATMSPHEWSTWYVSSPWKYDEQDVVTIAEMGEKCKMLMLRMSGREVIRRRSECVFDWHDALPFLPS